MLLGVLLDVFLSESRTAGTSTFWNRIFFCLDRNCRDAQGGGMLEPTPMMSRQNYCAAVASRASASRGAAPEAACTLQWHANCCWLHAAGFDLERFEVIWIDLERFRSCWLQAAGCKLPAACCWPRFGAIWSDLE